eukprot:scaffold16219_cov65-Phaeocystis_antarctica.AAC.2
MLQPTCPTHWELYHRCGLPSGSSAPESRRHGRHAGVQEMPLEAHAVNGPRSMYETVTQQAS